MKETQHVATSCSLHRNKALKWALFLMSLFNVTVTRASFFFNVMFASVMICLFCTLSFKELYSVFSTSFYKIKE